LIALYRRYCELTLEIGMAVYSEARSELERIRVEIDHPSQAELGRVTHEIHRAMGLRPWDDDTPLDDLDAAAGHPFADELATLDRLRRAQHMREEWAYICDGPHPAGWSRDDAVADFHRRYGED
jgi:hypothetical protein